MSDAGPREPDPAILDANLAALTLFCPRAADAIRQADPPFEFESAIGRDGRPTFAWRDEAGQQRWLGRTTMPSVRSEALIDAFQHGSRNALVRGFEQGAEAALLLKRMAAHQAVFVIDDAPWSVRLSLRLHDFANDLRRGRLLLFVGPEAWSDLQTFLLEHDGFVTPERVLAWPWFDAAMIADVSDRLSAIGAVVARRRSERIAELRRARRAERPSGDTALAQSIAVVSNIADPRVLRMAADLRAAAGALNLPCLTFVPDGPVMVHPHAIETALWTSRPTLVVLLDIMPAALAFELPPGATLVMTTHTQTFNATWLAQLPNASRLGVITQRQLEQAVAQEIEPTRIVLLPPAAAATAPSIAPAPRPQGLIVLADGADPSAEAVGLHLATHCRLWDAAGQLLQDRCNDYYDEQAEQILASAERSLKTRIDSDTVRAGIVTRIRQVLGPVLVRRAYCLALIHAGIEFDLYGGWQHDPILARYDRGTWPGPDDLAAALQGRRLAISIEPSGRPNPALLDALAAGLCGAVRRHPLDATPDGLAAVLDPVNHVARFGTLEEMIKTIKSIQAEPDGVVPMAARAADHVRRLHTWTARLRTILQACQSA